MKCLLLVFFFSNLKTKYSGKFKFKKIWKREDDINAEDSFSDLGIKIRDNSFFLSFNDKRDGFPFSIFRVPYLCSNIPSKIFYSTFVAEILRITRVTNTCNEFWTSSKALLSRAQDQGGNTLLLKRPLSKYFDRHFELFQKFSNTSITFLNSFSG